MVFLEQIVSNGRGIVDTLSTWLQSFARLLPDLTWSQRIQRVRSWVHCPIRNTNKKWAGRSHARDSLTRLRNIADWEKDTDLNSLYIAGYEWERDEFRRRRFELDERAFSNEESEDSIPGSGESSSTEESDEIEPSQEIAPVLGVPIYSPDLFPGQVLGYPMDSLVLFPGRNGPSPSGRVHSTLELDPEATLMFALAFVLTRLCFVMAFYALVYARRRRFYPF